MNQAEMKSGIQEMFYLCGELILQFEPTDHFSQVPEGAKETDVSEYLDNQIWRLRTAAMEIFRTERETAKKVFRILDELEEFVKSYEVPGVAERWKEINPEIEYFDVAYDLIDEVPATFEQINPSKLMCHPTEESCRERKIFFRRAKLFQESLGLDFSRYRALQYELWETLRQVFRNDFPECL